jgi:hypothetical protein
VICVIVVEGVAVMKRYSVLAKPPAECFCNLPPLQVNRSDFFCRNHVNGSHLLHRCIITEFSASAEVNLIDSNIFIKVRMSMEWHFANDMKISCQ